MGYFLVVKSAPAVWQPWPWLAELVELGLGGSWDEGDGVCGVDGGEADGISPLSQNGSGRGRWLGLGFVSGGEGDD